MSDAVPAAEPLYASFPSRIQAVMLDGVLLVTVVLLGTSLAAAAPGSLGRWINLATILAVMLYEPVTVSRWGATLGHRALNLRVVHDGDGGPLPFPLALARWLAKAVLGLLSFMVMIVTARHQALHDLVGRSTVQVRDASRARPHDFLPARTAEGGRWVQRSILRRVALVIAYELALYVALGLALGLSVSTHCIDVNLCTPAEATIGKILGTVWIVSALALALLGWTGRLPGARARLADAPMEDAGDLPLTPEDPQG
jgi:uncharacterized RDD family membrane protein YckC